MVAEAHRVTTMTPLQNYGPISPQKLRMNSEINILRNTLDETRRYADYEVDQQRAALETQAEQALEHQQRCFQEAARQYEAQANDVAKSEVESAVENVESQARATLSEAEGNLTQGQQRMAATEQQAAEIARAASSELAEAALRHKSDRQQFERTAAQIQHTGASRDSEVAALQQQMQQMQQQHQQQLEKEKTNPTANATAAARTNAQQSNKQ